MTLDDMSLLLEFKELSSAAMTISFAIQELSLQLEFKASSLLHFQLRPSDYKMALNLVLPF